MPKNNGTVQLTSLDDLFTTQEQRDNARREKVQDIPLTEIHDFPNHPFRVVQDDAMNEMAESVRQFGVLVPAMVRPREDGGYELISGHRRKLASTLAGLDTLPCIVREITDDVAIIVMVDSNLQREQLLPSEKAKAYKMKLEAMKRQGMRRDLTSDQVGPKLGSRSNHELADQSPDSKTQIQRFIRLTNLIPELLSLVDEGRIGMTPAVELSYLPPEEQTILADAIESEDSTPSLSQAQRLRKMSGSGSLNEDTALKVMMEQKKPPLAKPEPARSTAPKATGEGIVLPLDVLYKYFPQNYDLKKIEGLIFEALKYWKQLAQHREMSQKKGGQPSQTGQPSQAGQPKRRSGPER